MEHDIIGEVIEASTTDFKAESRELHAPPAFGSFVKVLLNPGSAPAMVASAPTPSPTVEDDPFDTPMDRFRSAAGGFGRAFDGITGDAPGQRVVEQIQPASYAIVYQASTGPVDTSRKLRAFWKGEDEMREEHPEVAEWMLVTHFDAVIIGHSLDGSVHHLLPPQPPKLFSHVRPCDDAEIRQIASKMDFLRTLVNSRNAPAEEVIAACILRAYDAHNNDFDFLVAAGKELAGILKDDYDRLQAIIRRVSPW